MIGCLGQILVGPENPARIADPEVRIVSLTVTVKAIATTRRPARSRRVTRTSATISRIRSGRGARSGP